MPTEVAPRESAPPSPPQAPASAWPVSVLGAHAAVTLVREELAHTLSAPVLFLDRVVRELEAGRAVGAEQLEIAREEVARLEKLVVSLREVPEVRAAPRPVDLAREIRQAIDEQGETALHSPAGWTVAVADSVRVLADPAVLGFVLHAAVAALAARGAEQVSVSLDPPNPTSGEAVLSIRGHGVPPVGRAVAAHVFAGHDSDESMLGVAREMARSAGTVLRSLPEAAEIRLDLSVCRGAR